MSVRVGVLCDVYVVCGVRGEEKGGEGVCACAQGEREGNLRASHPPPVQLLLTQPCFIFFFFSTSPLLHFSTFPLLHFCSLNGCAAPVTIPELCGTCLSAFLTNNEAKKVQCASQAVSYCKAKPDNNLCTECITPDGQFDTGCTSQLTSTCTSCGM